NRLGPIAIDVVGPRPAVESLSVLGRSMVLIKASHRQPVAARVVFHFRLVESLLVEDGLLGGPEVSRPNWVTGFIHMKHHHVIAACLVEHRPATRSEKGFADLIAAVVIRLGNRGYSSEQGHRVAVKPE